MASIDTAIANAQSFALGAAASASSLMEQAVSSAQFAFGTKVTAPEVDYAFELDPLETEEGPTYLDRYNPPTMNLASATQFTTTAGTIRSDMKTFTQGSITDWVTAFAPDHVATFAAIHEKAVAGMEGGSALSDGVEQSIFERARSRVAAENDGVQAQLQASLAKRGFTIPPGALAAGLRQVQKDSADRIAAAAAETAIERAKMEIQHVQFAMGAAQSLSLGTIQTFTQYTGVVATVLQASLTYATALVDATVGDFKAYIEHASARVASDDVKYKNLLAEANFNVDRKVKELKFLLDNAALLLDKAKAQAELDVKAGIISVQGEIKRMEIVSQAASAGARCQGDMAASVLGSQASLISALDAADD